MLSTKDTLKSSILYGPLKWISQLALWLVDVMYD
jgi:hypothetical protein